MSRRWRTRLLLLTLFAALGVLTRELPDCVNLSDDVSNIGSIPAVLRERSMKGIPARDSGGGDFLACLPGLCSEPAVRLLARLPGAISLNAARSLLLLFCVQLR